MQHYDDMPKIPTITAEEAMKLSWLGAGHPGRTRPAEAQGTDHRTVTETPSDSPQTAAEGVFHRSMIDSWFLLW